MFLPCFYGNALTTSRLKSCQVNFYSSLTVQSYARHLNIWQFNNSSLRVLAYSKNTLIADWTVGNLHPDLTPLFSFLLMNSTWWLVILCSLFHLMLSYYTVFVTYYWFVYSYCLRSKYTDNYFSVKIDKCHVVITHLKKDFPCRPITSLTLATKLLSTSYVLWWVVLGDI